MSALMLGAAAVAAYLLLAGKDEGEVGKLKVESNGKVTTTVPTADGKGYKLTTSKEDLAAIMAMAKGNNPSKLRIMGKQYRALGKINEAIACEKLAQYIELNQATGGGYTPGVASPKTSAPPVSSQPPAELVRALVAATDRQDTAKMRSIASELRALGFGAQADTVEAAAMTIEASRLAQKGTPVSTPTSASPKPLPEPSVRVLPTPVKVTPPTPRRSLADALVKHLDVDSPAKGKEDQSLVTAYQKTAGLKADGMYGPGTARTLSEPESGEHVPPAPRRWPSGTYAKAAKDYDAWLSLKQAQDPARSAEWSEAKKHSRDYYPKASTAKVPAIKLS